jgi:hypothetical protein
MERIDFTALPKARRQQASKEEQEAAKKDYAHRMAELQAEVQAHTHVYRALTHREHRDRLWKIQAWPLSPSMCLTPYVPGLVSSLRWSTCSLTCVPWSAMTM